MSTSQPGLPWPWLSVWQVKTLIAFGRTDMAEFSVGWQLPWGTHYKDRWGVTLSYGAEESQVYPVRELRLLLARINWWKRRKEADSKTLKCLLPNITALERSSIRRLLHRYGRPASELLSEAQKDARAELARWLPFHAVIKQAQVTLCLKAAEGSIVAYTHRGTELTSFDWMPDGPLGRKWSDLRFKRSDAVKLWPFEASAPRTDYVEIERDFTNWLAPQMRAARSKPVSKNAMRALAGHEGISVPSGRGFNRSWADAIRVADAPAWTKGGRRRPN